VDWGNRGDEPDRVHGASANRLGLLRAGQAETDRRQQLLFRLFPDDLANLAGGVPTVLELVSDGHDGPGPSCHSGATGKAGAIAGHGNAAEARGSSEANRRAGSSADCSSISSTAGSCEAGDEATRSFGFGLDSRPAPCEAAALVSMKEKALGRLQSAKRFSTKRELGRHQVVAAC
jgi:hypothetical protein